MKSSAAPARISRAIIAATNQLNTSPYEDGNESLDLGDRHHQSWQFDTAMMGAAFSTASTRCWMAAVFDFEMRLVLNAALYRCCPTSTDIIELDQKTINLHGVPHIVMCDDNIEFHDSCFVDGMSAMGVALTYSPATSRARGQVERFFGRVVRAVEAAAG